MRQIQIEEKRIEAKSLTRVPRRKILSTTSRVINFEHVRWREFPDDEVLVGIPKLAWNSSPFQKQRGAHVLARQWETIAIARNRTARSFPQCCADRSGRWIVRTIIDQEAVAGRSFIDWSK